VKALTMSGGQTSLTDGRMDALTPGIFM